MARMEGAAIPPTPLNEFPSSYKKDSFSQFTSNAVHFYFNLKHNA